MVVKRAGKFYLRRDMPQKKGTLCTIRVLDPARIIRARMGENLAEKIRESGILLSMDCRKRGVCGKCFVRIIDGPLPQMSKTEKHWIHLRNLPDDARLACKLRVQEDMIISIPEESLLKEVRILSAGPPVTVAVDPAVKRYFLTVEKPRVSSPVSSLDLLKKRLGKEHLLARLEVTKKWARLMDRAREGAEVTLYGDTELLDVRAGKAARRNAGIAVDLGTTTVVVEMVDLDSGLSLSSAQGLNPQSLFGADVVSRISHAFRNPKNLGRLRAEIQGMLQELVSEMLRETGTEPGCVHDVVVAGNTAMNHLLLGVPVDSLALAPFHAAFSSLEPLPAREAGFRSLSHARVYMAPNIQGFVGGDISSGMAATGLQDKEGTFLYIDLGTNGEIVLKTNKAIVATSTAAGPAFEGMNISCGMMAQPGAVYRAEMDGALRVHTIGDQPARGVCGTGLIDLLALFLEQGKVAPGGKVEGGKLSLPGGLVLDQKDIREVQTAAAAIKSGIKMILAEFGLTPASLDGIILAGAFGTYLNIRNSQRIGLLPSIEQEKIHFVGNAALAGAKVLLLSSSWRRRLERLVKRVGYISLASRPSFQQRFIESLELGPWK